MPAIWKIRNKQFWILGTLHFMMKEDYPLPDFIQEPINIAESLVLEDKDFLVKGQNIGLYEKDRNITLDLSKEAINLLLKRCKEFDLDFNTVQTLKPWKASITFLVPLGASIGFSFEYGLDKYILESSLDLKKQVASLEDSSKVLLALERLTLEDQEKMLINILKDVELTKNNLVEIHKAWKIGSEELIIKTAHEPMKIYQNLFQQVILDRNNCWLPNIKKLIDQKSSTLVAVGTAHLFGESNIINQLINAGYNIDRLA